MCGSDLSVWRGAARSCRAFVGVGGAYFRSAHFTSVELYAPGAFGLETRSKTPPSNRHVRHNNTYKQLYARTTSAVRTTATGSPRGGACAERTVACRGYLSQDIITVYHTPEQDARLDAMMPSFVLHICHIAYQDVLYVSYVIQYYVVELYTPTRNEEGRKKSFQAPRTTASVRRAMLTAVVMSMMSSLPLGSSAGLTRALKSCVRSAHPLTKAIMSRQQIGDCNAGLRAQCEAVDRLASMTSSTSVRGQE